MPRFNVLNPRRGVFLNRLSQYLPNTSNIPTEFFDIPDIKHLSISNHKVNTSGSGIIRKKMSKKISKKMKSKTTIKKPLKFKF